MKKIIKLFVYLFLIATLSNESVFAKTSSNSSKMSILATAPPTVVSPIYLCQNSAAAPLTATPSVGGTLNWYLTNTPTETPTSAVPTPNTTTVGATTYYVTQTIAGVESTPRTPIVVNVVADNGAVILGYRCDPSQILAADKNSSVFFDWGNSPLIPDNSYNYSYTTTGGASGSGNTTFSHYQIYGMMPGQSATLILTARTKPCATQTLTCSVPCITITIPNFPAIPSLCTGTTAPVLGTTSPNGITGTWSPAVVNNTTSGNYVFTPNPLLFPCALTQTLSVTVTPLIAPTFTTIPSIVCQGATAPVLPLNSSNTSPISGTWNPPTVDTSTLGTAIYTFIPNPGQCASAVLTTTSITILPASVSPNFAPIPALCSGSPAPVLQKTSPAGITGTWSPAMVNNAIGGNYVFTPNPNQCAIPQTLNVVVTPKTIPNFAAIPAFCSGSVAPILAPMSPNGVTGTWLPSAVSNTTSGSYLFTPNATECATTQTLNVVVNAKVIPGFLDLNVCSGSIAPILSPTSPNGIAGTWNPATVDNTTSGTYVFTPDVTECATTKTINVTVNPSNTLVSLSWTVTDAFAKNQMVTVVASAAGNYLYQMDSGPFQSNPVFENVAYGLHSITVQDVNGCSSPLTDDNVLIIGYPKYFTPNGDTYNDTWNIKTLSDQLNSRVYIFDRYGKLLKDISPNGSDWDGTYMGKPMPADDYWFTVEYVENNSVKKFKSHFSLKR